MSEHPAQKPDAATRRMRPWKRWTLPPLAVIGLVCAAVYLLTATSPGLRFTLGIAEAPISAAIQGRFSVQGVSGSIWSELKAEHLSVAMPDGLSVEGANLRFVWDPMALFGGRLEVDAVGAEQLAVMIPDAAPSPPGEDEAEARFSIPRLPLRVALRQLAFPSVSVTVPGGSVYEASLLGSVSTTESDEIRTVLDVAAEHEGKPVDRVTLKALVQPGDAPEMEIDLSADIPEDGVLFALLDAPAELKRPISVSVSGRGVPEGWSGDVRIMARELAGLNGKAGLGLMDEGLRVSFDGIATLLDPAALGLPGDLAGDYSVSVPDFAILDEALSVEELSIDKKGLAKIALSARMALDGSALSADGRLALDPDAASLFQVPIGYAGAEVAFKVGGALTNLEAAATITARELSGFGNSARLLDGTVAVVGSLDGGFDVTTGLSAKGFTWGEEAIGQLLGETPALSARATIDPTFQSFGDIAVTVDPLGASLRTNVRIDGGAILADTVEARLADFSRLEPLLGLPIAGSGSVQLTGLSLAEDGSVSAVFRAAADGFAIVDEQVTDLVGAAPSVSGDLLLTDKDGLAVTLHDVQARTGTATGVLLFDSEFAELSGQVRLRAVPSAIPVDAGLVVGGDAIALSATFAGPFATPDADVVVEPFDGEVAGTGFLANALEAQLRWRGSSPFVTFQAAGSAMGLNATVDGGVAVEPDGLDVPGVSVTGEGWSAWAAAKLPNYVLPADGAARVVVGDASSFAALAGLAGLSGRAEIDAQFAAGAGAGAQSVAATVGADGIAVLTDPSGTPITIERVDVSANLGDALTLRDIDGTVSLRSILGDGFNLAEVGLTLQGSGSAVEGDVTVKGVDPTPVTLSSKLSARLLDEGGELNVTELQLAYATLERLAAGSAKASFGTGGDLAASVDLSVLSGALAASYDRTGGAAWFTLDATGIPLGPLATLQGQKGVEGAFNAKADLRQEGGPVAGTFSAAATGLRTEELDADVSVDLTVDGTVADNRVRVEARTAGAGLDNVDVRAGLPVSVSLVTPGATVDQGGALDGLIKAEIELLEIWPYLPLPEHAAAGRMDADIRLGGTPANPAVEGRARLQDAEYEHLVHGTLIRNLQGVLRFAGEDFVLESLSGQDPYGGSFAIDGNGSLAGGSPTFDIGTKLNTLRVVNSDAVKADLDADIRSVQSADGMVVQGRALIKRAEVNLSVALPPSIATLDVEDGSAPERERVEDTEPSRIALDLTVDAPGQIFVRGRGLESEWEGKVQVTGTATRPIISGGLSARRGRIDVIGKGFTLDQSTIKFFGGETIDPMLGIRGVHEGDDITVIALLEGPASKPEIKLQSQPPLPQDEVLSRLLFGKTASSLGPLEAAQLAASASELAGGGSGIDVLGTIRDFVGVDVLEVDTSGDTAAVKAGSYVADGVFVGAKQGAAPGSGSVAVEVEVTPNISVTTESGATSSNAGVNFKWDY